jgi:hypothetical protein
MLRAIITHCGSEIVTGDEREISAKIRAIGDERHVDVRFAYDGMKVKLCGQAARTGVTCPTYAGKRAINSPRKRSTSSGFFSE